MFLEVRPSNAPGQGLYQRLGFEPIGRRRGYYPAGSSREDAVVMGLSL
jgi:ribosomal-protein-alanine N-acetyltransferase